jgi:hypothetical protein
VPVVQSGPGAVDIRWVSAGRQIGSPAARRLQAAVLLAGLVLGAAGSGRLPTWPGALHRAAAFPAYPATASAAAPAQAGRPAPRDQARLISAAAAVAVAAAGHHCLPVARWPKRRIPLGAVMMPPSSGPHRAAPVAAWYPFDQAWSLAGSGRADTALVCAR